MRQNYHLKIAGFYIRNTCIQNYRPLPNFVFTNFLKIEAEQLTEIFSKALTKKVQNKIPSKSNQS